jgi:glutaryl-CoA dehydrogenase (non-decarboxylating)
MDFTLTPAQTAARDEFRQYVATHVAPHAGDWDRAQLIPRAAIADLARRGYLGATIATEYGGRQLDQVTHGLLIAEIGAGCSSLRTLLTVHSSLVAETLQRWGSADQKDRWLPLLARGEKLAAFALSEPGTGSDAQAITTRYEEVDGGYELTGAKKWTSFGQLADVFLTFARNERGVTAFLVERGTPGVIVSPLTGILGTRASQLAEIRFEGCRVPAGSVVGRRDWGFLQIANTALDHGRYSVACGCLGIVRASLMASLDYAAKRQQFGKPLDQFQLIQRRLARMTAAAAAVQLLCRQAGRARDARDPGALLLTSLAKYAAAAAATETADSAVQIHGALGCHDSYPIERYYRDARVTEIIEGSTEMQELLLGGQARALAHQLFDS